ncbi:hypothetical protein EF847_03555 [Actinobacteria bacterium YIM 96077]|uniref:Uncharacterized protein n=1 Tax=Phytoactinopolyspora halophila TaxID=1981511 RepID=A0A329R2H5_9ACTN|nr:hypothetical protein [Phytoactinopolyspora halophila]AYY11921.1 hypothetical protein EF847_03555 [Actinobacteria bacterium YIM 96077]RAW18845.1 hypothetical protein DPM12_01955 [Phytoactinopolyspora halophila]
MAYYLPHPLVKWFVLDDALRRYERRGTVPRRWLRPERVVLVPGRAAGGPGQLSGAVVDVLTECEVAGAPTVLLAGEIDDLDAPIAAVCRYVASDRPEVVEEARHRYGQERVHTVDSIEAARARAWIGPVRAAAERDARRHPRRDRRPGWLRPLRTVYEGIRRRARSPERGRSRSHINAE